MSTRATRTPSAKPTRRGAWKPKFLEALEQAGTVTAACQAAGIGRRTAYDMRQRDEEFALAWADAEERITEQLEREAVRRALDGSDKLIEFLLKARRPEKYRESFKVEHSGKVGTDVASLTTGQLQAMADGLTDARNA